MDLDTEIDLAEIPDPADLPHVAGDCEAITPETDYPPDTEEEARAPYRAADVEPAGAGE